MKTYFTSTIFRKVLAALSGLFLVVFLFGHLVGNLQLFIPGVNGQTQFNQYAQFMTMNPLVKILSVLTYSSIILHISITIFLAIKSNNTRSVQYEVSSGNINSTWSSRNMTLLGVILMFFIIVHMKSFWYEMHFGEIPYQNLHDGEKIKDLHTIVIAAFKNPYYTFFYVFSMVALAMHLHHGVESAFHTTGVRVRQYEKPLKYLTNGIAIIVPAIFAAIPLYIFITR